MGKVPASDALARPAFLFPIRLPFVPPIPDCTVRPLPCLSEVHRELLGKPIADQHE